MSVDSKMTAIADAIRAKTGGTEALTLDQMATEIEGIEAGGGGFPNGTEWTQSNVTSGYYNMIEYANGVFVACTRSSSSYSDTGTTGIWYSTDGMTWTQSNVTSGGFSHLANNGIVWVALGSTTGIWYSTDGMTWTQSNVTSGSNYLQGVVIYDNGLWFASNYQTTYYSTDGMTWTQSSLSNHSRVSGYYKGVWIASKIVETNNDSSNGIWYSTDGMTWTQCNVTSGSHTVKLLGDKLVAFGSNGIWYSTDGMTWTQSNVTSGYTVNVATYYRGLMVAWFDGDGLWYSSDGATWTQSNQTSYRGIDLHEYNGALFASGNSYVGRSTNGMRWSRVNYGSMGISFYADRLYDACGVLVAASASGSAYTTNGTEWVAMGAQLASVDTSTASRDKAVCHARGVWVSASKTGIYYSPTWLPSE